MVPLPDAAGPSTAITKPIRPPPFLLSPREAERERVGRGPAGRLRMWDPRSAAGPWPPIGGSRSHEPALSLPPPSRRCALGGEEVLSQRRRSCGRRLLFADIRPQSAHQL